MKKEIIIIFILIIISIAFTSFVYLQTKGEWVCIAKKCVETVTGDAWAATYCKPNEEKTDIICEFVSSGNTYNVSLSQLDTSNLESCVKDACAASVYIKNNGGIK